jgi:hypothetical protein
MTITVFGYSALSELWYSYGSPILSNSHSLPRSIPPSSIPLLPNVSHLITDSVDYQMFLVHHRGVRRFGSIDLCSFSFKKQHTPLSYPNSLSVYFLSLLTTLLSVNQPCNFSLHIKEISGDRLLPFFIVKAVLESRIMPSCLGKI